MAIAARARQAIAWVVAWICPALISIVAAAAPAAAAPYADLVLDMRDGSVLHATNADRLQHPASLTKMMTLYLTFEAIKSGQLGLDQVVRVSAHAAAQPASKLYLKAGQRVTIRDLIRGAAIKSANDASMVLAEAIAGSEAAFGRLMTARARQLGMTSSTFRNPHGLSQSGHMTTARDMGLLARRLYFDHPEFFNVFGRRSGEAAGRRLVSTNRLLSTYPGADGIKTGYTRAAGYNLVASARRGNKHVVAVVLGGSSSSARNARVTALLDQGFAKVREQVLVVAPSAPRAAETVLAAAPVPAARPALAPTGIDAIAGIVTASAEAATEPPAGAEGLASPELEVASLPLAPDLTIPQSMVEASSGPATKRAPRQAVVPTPRPGGEIRLAGIGAVDAGAAPSVPRAAVVPGMPLPPERPGAAPAARAGSGATPRDAWGIQVGAYRQRAQAVRRANQLRDGEMVAAASPSIEPVKGRKGTLYRVRFMGMDRADAAAACRTMKARGQDCLTVAPGG